MFKESEVIHDFWLSMYAKLLECMLFMYTIGTKLICHSPGHSNLAQRESTLSSAYFNLNGLHHGVLWAKVSFKYQSMNFGNVVVWVAIPQI